MSTNDDWRDFLIEEAADCRVRALGWRRCIFVVSCGLLAAGGFACITLIDLYGTDLRDSWPLLLIIALQGSCAGLQIWLLRRALRARRYWLQMQDLQSSWAASENLSQFHLRADQSMAHMRRL